MLFRGNSCSWKLETRYHLSNEDFVVDLWVSNLNVHPDYLARALTHTQLGPNPRASESLGLGWCQQQALLMTSK